MIKVLLLFISLTGCATLCPPPPKAPPIQLPKLASLPRPDLPKFELEKLSNGTYLLQPTDKDAILQSLSKLMVQVENYEELVKKYNELVERELIRVQPKQ